MVARSPEAVKQKPPGLGPLLALRVSLRGYTLLTLGP